MAIIEYQIKSYKKRIIMLICPINKGNNWILWLINYQNEARKVVMKKTIKAKLKTFVLSRNVVFNRCVSSEYRLE